MPTLASFASAAMAIFASYTVALPAPASQDCPAVTGPFYLTGLPSNGSATYPLFVATVSRGVPVISSATSYFQQWTYNSTDNRLYTSTADNTTGTGNAALQEGSGVIFGDEWAWAGSPYGDNGLVSLVTDGECNYYVVMNGSESIYGWNGMPTTSDNLPYIITWQGTNGNGQANAAIRVGT